MNNASANIIKRQLLIIQFLLESNYVSTADIQAFLKSKDIDVPLRTLQRDLVGLEEILPIECRKEDKPYSWRWQRLANTASHDLTMSQALALRIVETELKGVIPKDLYSRLAPLFIKAQFTRGLAEMDFDEKGTAGGATEGKKDTTNFMDVMPNSPSQNIIMMLKLLYHKQIAKSKKPSATYPLAEINQSDMQDLIKELDKHGLGFLAELLHNNETSNKK